MHTHYHTLKIPHAFQMNQNEYKKIKYKAECCSRILYKQLYGKKWE